MDQPGCSRTKANEFYEIDPDSDTDNDYQPRSRDSDDSDDASVQPELIIFNVKVFIKHSTKLTVVPIGN